MVIRWSDEDDVFIVTLPEFDNTLTHGRTYEEAVRQGKSLIESMIHWYKDDGRQLPLPLKHPFEYDNAIENGKRKRKNVAA